MKSKEELLFDYLDGQASKEEQQQVEQLLNEDATVYAQFMEIKQLDETLSNQQLLQPSKDFASSIMTKIKAQHYPARSDFSFIVSTSILSLILVIVWTLSKFGFDNEPILPISIPNFLLYLSISLVVLTFLDWRLSKTKPSI